MIGCTRSMVVADKYVHDIDGNRTLTELKIKCKYDFKIHMTETRFELCEFVCNVSQQVNKHLLFLCQRYSI